MYQHYYNILNHSIKLNNNMNSIQKRYELRIETINFGPK